VDDLPPVPASPFAVVNRETDAPGGQLEVGEANVIYRCLRAGSPLVHEEVWVEVRLDAHWVAAFRVEPEDGQPVVSELRVLPYEDDPERNALLGPGERSGDGAAPGGVPLEKVRNLRADRLLQTLRGELERLPPEAEYFRDVFADFAL
jgi:hypothetical protein